MKKLEIFKPGRHTAMNGAVLEFSDEHLNATAQAYDPALREAPLVVGHPTLDAPAYGWVKSLSYADGLLYADPDQVDPAFAELVNAGRFKKISASFYTPTAKNNPKPGTYYLRHVGFLGAAAPAVAGLKSASFSETDDGVIEFGDWVDTQHASMWRRMRDWFIGKFGLEEADKVIPDYAVASLEDAARSDAKPQLNPAFAQSPHQETTVDPKDLAAKEAAIKKKEDDLNTQAAAFAEREKKLQAQEAQAKRAGVGAFVEGLVKDGRLLPRDQAPLVEFMAAVDDEAVIEFADGDEQKKTPRGQWLREFLARLPKQVDYAEHAKAGDDRPAAGSVAAPHGYSVDPARAELHAKALAYAETNKCDYVTAITAVGQ